MGTQSYLFNAFGDVVEHSDAAGVARCFSHDALGRLDRIEAGPCLTPGELIASFDYDGSGDNEIGRLVSTFRKAAPGSAEGTTVRYHYQPRPASGPNRGLLSAIERIVPGAPEPFTTSFDYEGPRLAAITYPAAAGEPFSISYDYDDFGNLRSASDGASAPLWELVEAEQGIFPKLERFGNDVQTTFEYFSLSAGALQCNPAEEACVPGMLRSLHTDPVNDKSPHQWQPVSRQSASPGQYSPPEKHGD